MCDALALSTDTPYSELFPDADPAEQVLWSTQRAAVLIDVAPLAEGHCLIIPTAHRIALAHATAEEFQELEELKGLFTETLHSAFGVKPVYFEHGQCQNEPDDHRSCAIAHAHLHLVPVGTDCFGSIRARFPFQPLARWSDITTAADGTSGYLYIEDERGCGLWTARTPQPQALRRCVADALDLEDPAWNWHDQVVHAVAMRTADRVRAGREAIIRALP